MAISLEGYLSARLAERKAQHLYRQRRILTGPQGGRICLDGADCLNFSSNDYLGLAAHPEVAKTLIRVARSVGIGAGASHLICGHSQWHHRLEEVLAEFTGRPRALLFSTGYMANMALISALVGRNDAVFQDRLNHASLVDGGILSRARVHRFHHANAEHAASLMAESQAPHKLLVTDGVFSMDGDQAPLAALASAAVAQNAWLMVDDAHGFGCLGATGAGTIEHHGLNAEQVPILMATLGKAAGGFGAFVAGSDALVEYLIQAGRPYVYTTAMPSALAAANLAAVELMIKEPWHRQHLQALIAHFRQLVDQASLPILPSTTPIQPLLVGDSQVAVAMSDHLLQLGIYVCPIRPPTVPKGEARLRIALSAAHSLNDIERLVEGLSSAYRAHCTQHSVD